MFARPPTPPPPRHPPRRRRLVASATAGVPLEEWNFPRPPPVSQVLGPLSREQPLHHVDRHILTVSRTASAREYSRVAACRRQTMRALACALLLWCEA